MMRRIVTGQTHSVLPTRQHDWRAHYDGDEEAGGYGYGATEADAILDLVYGLTSDNTFDLLVALKEMVAYSEEPDPDSKSARDFLLAGAYRKARMAIAKAEGRE